MAFKFFRRSDPYQLPLSMAGLKLGDRLLQVGLRDTRLFSTLASKVGLTGRACGLDEDPAVAAAANASAMGAGVLVETEAAPIAAMPYEGESFDLVVLRDVLPGAVPEQRVACLREVLRILRPAGRCLVIDTGERGGLGALLSTSRSDRSYSSGGAEQWLQAEGFKAARRLAEREGWAFVEGVKARPVQEQS